MRNVHAMNLPTQTHLITCLEQSKFVKANYNLSQSQIYSVLEQYDKETENFFLFSIINHAETHTETQIKLI